MGANSGSSAFREPLQRGLTLLWPRYLALWGFAIVLATGCATSGGPDDLITLRWPEPPEVVRIEHVQVIRGPQDLGPELSVGPFRPPDGLGIWFLWLPRSWACGAWETRFSEGK